MIRELLVVHPEKEEEEGKEELQWIHFLKAYLIFACSLVVPSGRSWFMTEIKTVKKTVYTHKPFNIFKERKFRRIKKKPKYTTVYEHCRITTVAGSSEMSAYEPITGNVSRSISNNQLDILTPINCLQCSLQKVEYRLLSPRGGT